MSCAGLVLEHGKGLQEELREKWLEARALDRLGWEGASGPTSLLRQSQNPQ